MLRVDKLEEIISKPLDPRITEPLKKGKTQLDYISGTSMLVLLKKAFGPFFSVHYGDPVVRTFPPCKKKKYKSDEYEDYFPKPVVEVKCTITVKLFDKETNQVVEIEREGFGTAVYDPTKEEMITKSASTDALKKAAYSFGFALELSAGKTQSYEQAAIEAADHNGQWFRETMFDEWTNDAWARHAEEVKFINAFMAKFQTQDYNEVARYAFNDRSAMLKPSNIVEAVAKCKASLMAKKQEGAAA